MSGKPAARLGDPTACPVSGHGNNPIASGSPDVLFDGLPAARMGDTSACGGALSGNLIANVLINGKPAATIGTVGGHGNVVIGGSGTVLIGASGGGAVFTSPQPLSISDASYSQCILIEDQDGNPLHGIPYKLRMPQGQWIDGHTDTAGLSQKVQGNAGDSIDFFSVRPFTTVQRLLGSNMADPQNDGYAGLPLESGSYSRNGSTWNYQNLSTGSSREDFLRIFQLYRWNFIEFNKA